MRMRLERFIREKIEDILVEWDLFAHSIQPDAEVVSAVRLRDHARAMLLAIAVDMGRQQSDAQQKSKSEGRGDRGRTPEDTPAHDLRSPLGAMLHSAQLLLRSGTLDTDHTKAAARIETSGLRMKTLISDLLDFATTKLGDALPVCVTDMDIGDSCRAAREEIADPCRSAPWPVRALTRGSTPDSRDPAAERSVGLGLYIACEIAKAHGGKLRLTGSDESGTTFTALLPKR